LWLPPIGIYYRKLKSGQFRSDLYHRLSVLTIKVPPVSERGEDKVGFIGTFSKIL
jgi:transcriptional regulator with GAF, ATPase, and Fis domain